LQAPSSTSLPSRRSDLVPERTQTTLANWHLIPPQQCTADRLDYMAARSLLAACLQLAACFALGAKQKICVSPPLAPSKWKSHRTACRNLQIVFHKPTLHCIHHHLSTIMLWNPPYQTTPLHAPSPTNWQSLPFAPLLLTPSKKPLSSSDYSIHPPLLNSSANFPFFLHASLYNSGNRSIGAFPCSQDDCQKAGFLSSPNVTTVLARIGIAVDRYY